MTHTVRLAPSTADTGDHAPGQHRILLVDDDPAILAGLCRQHHRQYALVPACGSEAGVRAVQNDGPFAVVIADFQMPGMNGIQFLAHAAEAAPDMIRIMLTGQADLHTAIEAVNRGHIFRFLTKPCEPEILRCAVDAALEQRRLRDAERLLLEQTVRGSIEVLADVLALANPTAFGRATRIRNYARHIVTTLRLADAWQYETAALLSQIGYVGIPNDVIDRISAGENLSPDQSAMLERHPELARDLLHKIPRLQGVAEMIARQRRHGAAGADAQGVDRNVVIGGRILAAAVDFEELVSLGATALQALAALRKESAKYGARIVDALATLDLLREETATRLVPLARLQVGMVLLEDVRNAQGNLIVACGHEVTHGSLERLRNYGGLHLLAKTEYRVKLA